ncbi:MAG: putative peptidoglycan lipid II flippase, partial [Marinobacter maritimus]
SLLWFGLYQKGIYQKQKDSVSVLLRIMIAGLVMAAGLVTFNPALQEWSQLTWLAAALKLFYLIVAGAVLYLFALGLTGLRFRHFQIRMAK